ncbi:F-box protein [Candidatus Protochlamydia phocaeensis]|uniref:F-box protein n=1 Tax=Candidatus Protochlamydia phocaeensis TaxID=1414722 RepID=UPI0008391752|nr:F-box protein [Candidatus Protochlamydia phocaeensis]
MQVYSTSPTLHYKNDLAGLSSKEIKKCRSFDSFINLSDSMRKKRAPNSPSPLLSTKIRRLNEDSETNCVAAVKIKINQQVLFIPFEIIIYILTFAEAKQVLAISLLSKQFFTLSEISLLWKELTLRKFPQVFPFLKPVTNWKNCYKQEFEEQINAISILRKYLCSFYPLHRAIKPGKISYYLAFNDEGRISAISCGKKETLQLPAPHNTLKTIPAEEWKICMPVYTHFIHLTKLDSDYPVNPFVQFQIIQKLTPLQEKRIAMLQDRINEWIQNTAEAEDLDKQVEETLKDHFIETKCLEQVRDPNQLPTPEEKAYFIFFRAFIGRFKFILSSGILIEENNREASSA